MTDARVLFHGTTDVYLAGKNARRSSYGHADGPVDLDESPLTPMGYANSRARSHDASPVLLVVSVPAVADRLRGYPGPQPQIDELWRQEYFSLEVPILSIGDREFFRLIAREARRNFGINIDLRI